MRSLIPERVKLIAVSKFHPVEAIQEAYDAGQRLFGENRAQELAEKAPRLPADIQWHFIGTLQRNKVKYIIPYVTMIQSVDSEALLREIVRQAERFDRKPDILLQYKIAREDTKSGLSREDLLSLTELYLSTPEWQERACLKGLMGMATQTENEAQIADEFGRMRQLQETLQKTYPQLSWTELSMGMSSDWQTAVRAGATMVRIGTAIFGQRT